MTGLQIIVALIAVALLIYLVFALCKAEDF